MVSHSQTLSFLTGVILSPRRHLALSRDVFWLLWLVLVAFQVWSLMILVNGISIVLRLRDCSCFRSLCLPNNCTTFQSYSLFFTLLPMKLSMSLGMHMTTRPQEKEASCPSGWCCALFWFLTDLSIVFCH
jgi:hypothetical protein